MALFILALDMVVVDTQDHDLMPLHFPQLLIFKIRSCIHNQKTERAETIGRGAWAYKHASHHFGIRAQFNLNHEYMLQSSLRLYEDRSS